MPSVKTPTKREREFQELKRMEQEKVQITGLVDKIFVDYVEKTYHDILEELFRTMRIKHMQHGISYRSMSFEELEKRALTEVVEYRESGEPNQKALEALDVAVFWILIADKEMREHHEHTRDSPK